MKFKDLLNENGDVKDEYRYQIFDPKSADLSTITEPIEDIDDYRVCGMMNFAVSFSGPKYHSDAVSCIEFENYSEHPEVIYQVLKHTAENIRFYRSMYNKLSDEDKLKLELEIGI